MKNTKKLILILGIILLMIGLFYSIYIFFFNDNKKDNNDINEGNNKVDTPVKEEVKELNIIDLKSNSRPYAVMINNLAAARKYHSGLSDAYVVYEMLVEGGITRLLALFKDADTSRIGSVRSSRHYYLDYALEHDAIYVHFGWSPAAQSDITTLGINNINGLYDSAFWRDTSLDIDYEHTAYTNIEKIESSAKSKGYRMTTNKDTLLNYSVDAVDLSLNADRLDANKVDIKYSSYTTTNYVYNEEEKLYYRSVNGSSHKDYITKEQYTAKNIIITYVDSSGISGDSKGRLNLKNIGSGDGYYITNGYAIPITWSKNTRKGETVYKTKDGKEILVNDGNTYIQIAPLNSAKIS